MKGILVLIVGAGILTLTHRNIQYEAMDIVQFFHLNPAHHYPEIFLKTLSDFNNADLWFLSVSAILYVVIRMAEAYGLWHNREWAIWFAAASSALFLPIEIFELYERIIIARLVIFLLNVALVLYLSRHLKPLSKAALKTKSPLLLNTYKKCIELSARFYTVLRKD